MMSHRAACNLVAFQLSSSRASARTLQFASLNFDVSFQEMFSTWSAGATLVLVDEETRRDAEALLRLVTEQRVERLFLPFVALQHLAEASEAQGVVPRDLREIVTAGEQLKITPSIRRLFAKLDDCHLDNHYGPTETHLATMWRLAGAAGEWPRLPPIGGPIANVQVYVLDEHYRLVPPGVVGELYIGGEGLARGYFNRPDQTAERFIPNPFSSELGARLYKTGDLVRRFDRSRLEYVGRSDRQVKVRGFRVEVGEIEATLKFHRDLRQAVVTDWDDQDGRKLLVAYVVAVADASPALIGELKGLLRDHLPEYMVPAVFMRMDKLPLLPNGKVDRRALPRPDRAATAAGYRAPRTPRRRGALRNLGTVARPGTSGCGGRLLRAGRPFATGNTIDVARAAVVSDRGSTAAAVRASDAGQAGPGCRSRNTRRARAASACGSGGAWIQMRRFPWRNNDCGSSTGWSRTAPLTISHLPCGSRDR